MEELVAFLVVAVVVIVTPGPDTALTIRNSLVRGRRGGIQTAAGVAAGQACWTLAASVGLAALLVASEPAFVALKYAGAAYLVLLGVQSLVSALGRDRERHAPRPARGGAPFRQGLISNLANPKMAVFFTSLLPQSASTFWTLLALGLLFATMTLSWLTAYAAVVARAGDLLRRSALRRALDAVTGAVLVALGLRLAAERR